jgi:hypothetical protein
MPNALNVVGERYGRLTAIRRDTDSPSRRVRWLWKCDCGKSVSILLESVRSGQTVSCGCHKRAVTKARWAAHREAKAAAAKPKRKAS